jgi:hypothetical protein
MNKTHKLPPGLHKTKVKRAKVIKVIESLLPPGSDLSNVEDSQIHGLLAQRIESLESQLISLQENVGKSVPVFQRFNFTTPRTQFPLEYVVNQTAPIQLIYETLPQKVGIDFEVDGDTIKWINASEDTYLLGTVEVIYYRA